LIVFLGVVVGSIVICMFLPIFKLSELVSASIKESLPELAEQTSSWVMLSHGESSFD